MMSSSSWRVTAGVQFTPEKMPVTGAQGVVAANHPLGSAAGLEMLTMGGNAIDAAVATLFTLNVVEPMMVGIFGAGWTNIRLADGSSIILDNYTAAPAAASPDLYTPIADTWPDYMETEGRQNRVGFRAVGVPGTLKAWAELVETWGQLDLETVMQPAIRHAERGFRASQYLCELIQDSQADLALDPDGAARIFLPGGQPPQPGDLIRQPELAASLRAIATEGPEVMYGGSLGQTMIEGIQQHGGILTLEDLSRYRTIRRKPLTASYRGYDITVPEPPCSGGLQRPAKSCASSEGYDVAGLGFGTADAIHLLAECFKIAFTDRARACGRSRHYRHPGGLVDLWRLCG